MKKVLLSVLGTALVCTATGVELAKAAGDKKAVEDKKVTVLQKGTIKRLDLTPDQRREKHIFNRVDRVYINGQKVGNYSNDPAKIIEVVTRSLETKASKIIIRNRKDVEIDGKVLSTLEINAPFTKDGRLPGGYFVKFNEKEFTVHTRQEIIDLVNQWSVEKVATQRNLMFLGQPVIKPLISKATTTVTTTIEVVPATTATTTAPAVEVPVATTTVPAVEVPVTTTTTASAVEVPVTTTTTISAVEVPVTTTTTASAVEVPVTTTTTASAVEVPVTTAPVAPKPRVAPSVKHQQFVAQQELTKKHKELLNEKLAKRLAIVEAHVEPSAAQ